MGSTREVRTSSGSTTAPAVGPQRPQAGLAAQAPLAVNPPDRTLVQSRLDLVGCIIMYALGSLIT